MASLSLLVGRTVSICGSYFDFFIFSHSIKSKEHVVQTFMYAAEFLVSYILMLIVMTYNIWIFIICIIGTGVGYFFIAWHQQPQQQACGGDRCANDCPNVVGERLSTYDQKPLDQELLPLSSRVEVCHGCENKFSAYECKETDILT